MTDPNGLTWAATLVSLAVAIPTAGHAVIYKRDPRSATLWVLLIALLPLGGSLLYGLFGINRYQRRARRLFPGADPAVRQDLSPTIPEAVSPPLAGLAHLVVSGHPAGVHHGTGGTYNAAQDLGQLLGQLDAGLHVLGDAAAHGDDHVGTDQVDHLLGGLHDLHDLGLHVVGSEGEVGLDDLAGIGLGLVKGGLLHHAGTDSGHGGTEAGADDGGHQVTAESGTGHLQVAVTLLDAVDGSGSQGGGGAQEVLVLGHVDVQVGAVGAQTGVQTGSQTGAQVTADVGGADEEDLGLLVLHQVTDDLGVGVGGVDIQQLVVAVVHLVGAVAAQGLQVVLLDVLAQHHAAQLHAQVVGQLAALGEELVAGGHNHALALLTENPYALEGGGILTIKSHCVALLSLYQMMCLSLRMETSFSTVALSAPSIIIPAPFTGGEKDLYTFVGEPFRPMVSTSMRGSSFRVL